MRAITLEAMARAKHRQGAAAVELALLLPVLTFLLVISVDFARLYYHYVTITNCARNGALWLCDPVAQSTSKYATVDAAAQLDNDARVADEFDARLRLPDALPQ